MSPLRSEQMMSPPQAPATMTAVLVGTLTMKSEPLLAPVSGRVEGDDVGLFREREA